MSRIASSAFATTLFIAISVLARRAIVISGHPQCNVRAELGLFALQPFSLDRMPLQKCQGFLVELVKRRVQTPLKGQQFSAVWHTLSPADPGGFYISR